MASRALRLIPVVLTGVLGASALGSAVAYATGGTTWTAQSARSDYWAGVAYGGGTYVAVAANNVMTSPDGVTWTNQSVTGGWTSVMYDGSQFVAVGSSGSARAMTSPDGLAWTLQPSLSTAGYLSVAKGDDTYVAVAQQWGAYSNDAVTWTETNVDPAVANQWRSVTFGDDTFVAVNHNTGAGLSPVMTSTDGVTWTRHTAGISAEQWTAVTYGAGLFVAVGVSGTNRVMTSPDGVNWTGQVTPGSEFWRAVIYAGGQFVAVGHSGAVMTSPDAITWTAQTSGNSAIWRSITGGPQYVAVGQTSGTPVMTSYMYAAPTYSSISPSTGTTAGGEALTIDGTGFLAGVSVSIGGSSCTGVSVVSSSRLTCTSPPGVAGSANVVVTNPDTQSATGAAAFTFAAPPPIPPRPVPPSVPLDVLGVAGDHSVEVSWSAPASSGSFAVTNYQVTSSPTGGSCLVATTSCEISGLSDGTAYTFTVRALTGAGWSPWSAASEAVTPGPPAPPPVEPSIVITGTRGEVGGKPGIVVDGSTSGFGVGAILRPWVKFPGQASYSEGSASILVDVEGGFTWQRRTGKKVYVVIKPEDGSVKSNRVTIQRN